MMKNPSHPGELIGDILDEHRVTRVAAAEALGVSRQALNNIISGKAAITARMALRLEKALGSTASTWIQMQANYDLAKARKQAHPFQVKRLVAV